MDESLKADIVKELGINRLPPEEQDEALRRMAGVIFQSALVRIVDSLDDGARKEVEDFLADPAKNGDTDAFYALLKSKTPDLDEIIAEEIAAFKADALGTMKGIGDEK